MTFFEVTFNTDDPEIAGQLHEVERMPRSEERMEIEAALCQWFANKLIRHAGEMRGREKAFAHNRRRRT